MVYCGSGQVDQCGRIAGHLGRRSGRLGGQTEARV